MKIAPALLIALWIPAAAQAQTYLNNQQGLLCWQENRKLKWSDFQAKTSALKKGTPLYTNSGAHAVPELTVKGLVDSTGRNDFVVRPVFNQKLAWVRDSTLSTATLLAHEQLHFDICELTARKLRARIAHVYQAGGDVFDPRFTREIQRIMAEEDTLQDSYDQETAHGIHKEAQQKWQEQIRRALVNLSLYKSTARTCNAN